ncbi:MAG: M48 family metalloprotease [Candidatus Brocadiae bacterium]|nr:M48 family metalloprotease [Candidatus Brocadiia bacterium]
MHARLLAPRLRVLLVLALAVFGAAGCPEFNMLSTEDEVAIGQKIAAEVEKKQKICPDPTVQQYVREIQARIAAVCDRQDVTYRITVIEDHEQVNAFAGPGGFMYVYTGLLRAMSNEAELAGVLAHETGHVVARHSAKALSNMLILNQLAQLALGSDPAMAGQLAGQLVSGVGMAQMSRGAEHQADQLAVTYMKRAGYDPQAFVAFLDKLNRMKKTSPSAVGKLFASHPPTEERIAHVRSLIAQVGPGGRLGAQEYRQRLRGLLGRSAAAEPTAVALMGAHTTRRAPAPPANRTGRGPLMICRNLTKGNTVASRVVVASTADTRRRGLLGRHSLPADEGIHLIPCRSIHTIKMKFAIDVVFLDKQMRVVDLRADVKPGRPILLSRKAYSTLELAAGVIAARKIEVGDLLRIHPPSSPAIAPPPK